MVYSKKTLGARMVDLGLRSDYMVIQAESDKQIGDIRALFREYADSLGFSLCFQNFDQELAALPGDYAPPFGSLLLAMSGLEPAGCVALRPLDPAVASEMKRLYVRPQYRKTGLGRLLCEKAISEARRMGYRSVRLDTIEPKMQAAVALYRQLGFHEIVPYRQNPVEGALYLELKI